MSTEERQTKVIQRILQNNWTDLKDDVVLDPILPILFENKVIDFTLKEKITRMECPKKAIRTLLDHLYKTACEEKIEAFIKALEESSTMYRTHEQIAAKLRTELSTESDLVIRRERYFLRSQTENKPEEMQQEDLQTESTESEGNSESHEAKVNTTEKKKRTRSYKGDISSSSSSSSTESDDCEDDNNYERDGFVVSDSPVDSDSGELDESASVESDLDHNEPIKRSQTENKPEEMQQEDLETESTESEGDSTDSSESRKTAITTTGKRKRIRSYKGGFSSSPSTESDGEEDNNYERDGFIVSDSSVTPNEDSDSREPDESASVESQMDDNKPIKSDLEIGKENMSSSTRKSERIRSSKTHRKPFKDLNGVGKAVEHSNSWITLVKHTPSPYVPQLADKVQFIAKAYKKYEEKLKEFVSEKHLSCELLEIAPKLGDCNILCVVENISYEMAAETVAFFILHLRKTTDGSLMKIRYCNLTDVADFLVVAEHYDSAVKQTWTPSIGFCSYLGGDWVSGTVVSHSANKSHFETYKVLIEGFVYFLSPWEMFTLPNGILPCMEKNLDLKEVLNDITHLWEREEFSGFLEDVSAPEYRKCIPIPMCLSRIRDRIINSYYRTVQSLIFDLRLIYLNALAFNDESHPVGRKLVTNAHRIVHHLYQVITRNTDDDQECNSQEILDEESFLERYPAEFRPVGFSSKKPERNRIQNWKQIPAKRAKFLDSDEDSS